MDEKTMLILKGQSMIMEMLMSMMPTFLEDSWLYDTNEYNQEVINLFAKSGLVFKPAKDSKDETKE